MHPQSGCWRSPGQAAETPAHAETGSPEDHHTGIKQVRDIRQRNSNMENSFVQETRGEAVILSYWLDNHFNGYAIRLALGWFSVSSQQTCSPTGA